MNRTFRKSKRRDYLRIMDEILARAVHGALATQLMSKASLSYTQLENYLRILMKLNLLKKSARGKTVVYETTQKGKSYLEKYEELNRLLGD